MDPSRRAGSSHANTGRTQATYTKISKLVANLQRSCQQDKLYSHGLFQVVNKFETSS